MEKDTVLLYLHDIHIRLIVTHIICVAEVNCTFVAAHVIIKSLPLTNIHISSVLGLLVLIQNQS